MPLLFRLLLSVTLAAVPLAASAQEAFKFIALGDMPYGRPKQVYGDFRTLIATINQRAPDLVIHIGDIKSGSTPCSDTLLRDQLNFMNSMRGAVLYTPGDNEWTDCHRKKAGEFDPLERLDFLRKIFYANGAQTLGTSPLAVERQPAVMPQYATYVENARLTINGVHIIAAHVVGSNNNRITDNPAANQEYLARERANIAWLNDSFDKATRAGARAVVVAIHADMFRTGFDVFGNEGFRSISGFAAVGKALAQNARAFGKPVLLVYGDSHKFEVTRPFAKTAPNLVALQVYGASDMHAVEVAVDPEDAAVFSYRSVINPALTNEAPSLPE